MAVIEMDYECNFLLVEDDDDHAQLVMRSLQRVPVACSTDRVRDGVEALAYLRRENQYAGRPRPDAVLLDLKLPKMDGHEVLARIKNAPELQTIPVVILSTSDAEADRTKAYQRHANSYLVKPLDYEQFRKMVEDLIVYWGVWNQSTSRDDE
jgi:hypothetical protein